MLAAMLLGCTTPQTEPLPGGTDSTESGSDTGTTSDSGPDLLTPDEACAELDAFFEVGLPSPAAIRAAYYTAIEHGDEVCPGGSDQVLTPPQGCTSEEDYWFSGLVNIQDIPEFDGTLTGWNFSGEFEIIDDKGQVFGAGGSVGAIYDMKGYGSFIGSTISGSWHQDGGPPFLDAGFSGSLTMMLSTKTSDGQVSLDGVASYGNTTVVSFSEMIASENGCEEYLIGVAQVRDEHGRWYEINMTECTGCGMVSQDGVELGEGCLTMKGIPALIANTLKEEL